MPSEERATCPRSSAPSRSWRSAFAKVHVSEGRDRRADLSSWRIGFHSGPGLRVLPPPPPLQGRSYHGLRGPGSRRQRDDDARGGCPTRRRASPRTRFGLRLPLERERHRRGCRRARPRHVGRLHHFEHVRARGLKQAIADNRGVCPSPKGSSRPRRSPRSAAEIGGSAGRSARSPRGARSSLFRVRSPASRHRWGSSALYAGFIATSSAILSYSKPRRPP